MQDKQGLQLDRVVLLGHTFEEYRQCFLLEPADLVSPRMLSRFTETPYNNSACAPVGGLSPSLR